MPSPDDNVPADTVEFVAYHQPALLDGEYVLDVKQQVRIDGKYGWGDDQWSAAPGTRLQFSVAGPRFSLDPGVIQSQFPPPKSIGEYYGVLPHIILNRTTLPWERTIDNSPASNTAQPTPWVALLLFDKVVDGDVPTVTRLTVRDLATMYGPSAPTDGKPEFVKILPREFRGETQPGELRLEVGQHPDDRLTVIDVPKQLLRQILPGADEIALLSHVRAGRDSADPAKEAEYPVILCNRLPAPGHDSTVHLVSLEARQPLLKALAAEPHDNNLVRLVSLASWSFSTLQHNKTFTGWLTDAWCPGAKPAAPRNSARAGSCPEGVIHTLRMPAREDANAERFLSQGYAPVRHQTRQGNHLVSWYRGPLLPGQSPAADVTLPVRMSDQLVRYFGDVGMFDTTYAAAWELGRMLTLRSKQVSVSLFNWKRAHAQQHAQQIREAENAVSHLPFAPDYSIAPDFPEQVTRWFDELLRLKHVPFHYLVPREEMLPANSLRFFHVDINWLECLLDGAFSVGRVTPADFSQDVKARDAGHVPETPTYSGFLLRSPVVTGWPHLGVEAYTQAIPVGDGYLPNGVSPTKRLRFDRLGEDVLLCLFEGEIKTVDIHEHPETIHFGVTPGDDPSVTKDYQKALRDKKNPGIVGPLTDLKWKSDAKRTLCIADLATRGDAKNSAEFGVTMIAGVEKVRFIK